MGVADVLQVLGVAHYHMLSSGQLLLMDTSTLATSINNECTWQGTCLNPTHFLLCSCCREEFTAHGLQDLVTVECRDVCSDGFGVEDVADAGEPLPYYVHHLYALCIN